MSPSNRLLFIPTYVHWCLEVSFASVSTNFCLPDRTTILWKIADSSEHFFRKIFRYALDISENSSISLSQLWKIDVFKIFIAYRVMIQVLKHMKLSLNLMIFYAISIILIQFIVEFNIFDHIMIGKQFNFDYF